MESFGQLASFQLPFQKRLSRLYNDTKKSSDFVKEPIQNEEDPELKNLHRKLRIQKDRLISWGLEWSDPNQSTEIDESLSKAGLSEVVGSIMGTIKDILAEAEPLWLSSKRIVEKPRPSPDQKAPLVQWDKGRFEDLIRDLTVSIDTLYDLSRTRLSSTASRRTTKSFKSQASIEDFRPFESTRILTPQHIDPQFLQHLKQRNPGQGASSSREVVLMSKTAYSELSHAGVTREPWGPLLLEYATYDPIYTITGISPPMDRFEKLSAGLQQDPQRAPGAWTGLPRLLGYFEDMEKSRLGLVYRFPSSFSAVSIEKVTKTALYNLPTLRDLLASPTSEPPLEAKFKLAYNLTNTIFDLHARGITHGSLASENISFCDVASIEPSTQGTPDMRRPLVSSFDLFPQDPESHDFVPTPSLSRHPLDPRSIKASPLKSADVRVLELYTLATILLSIGLWANLEEVVENGAITDKAFERLSVKCGSLYTKATQACWSALEENRTDKVSGDSLLSSVQMKVSRFLEACCILDGVSGFEERLSTELHAAESETPREEPASKSTKEKEARSVKMPPFLSNESREPTDFPELIPRQELEVQETTQPDLNGKTLHMNPVKLHILTNVELAAKTQAKVENKIRLYPHVPLSPEAVERWNTVLMPQVNHALRHFYRKNPESVEVSLESVGPSPQKTEPTVVVVCSSVGKVRAILKKRMGEVFEGPGAFPLKVTRGHVVRSRRSLYDVRRSMADNDQDIEAINPEYQERPRNGASIGAWIGDRHLPPVSFGGLVLVDGKSYGMTVHHMLDDPEKDTAPEAANRSSAVPKSQWYAESMGDSSAMDDDFSYELSDTESEAYSDTDITSDYDDDDEDDYEEPGDIPGIEPGCGYGYVVTQPALDDVEDGFYPDSTTQDEDHLDSYTVGDIYASSGIRRKHANGLVHEVDWALFEFADEREPDDNIMPQAQANKSNVPSRKDENAPVLRPTSVAPSSALPGLEVQCCARTSGLQTGQILPALTSVKIYGRTSPSHTYQITSLPVDRSSTENPTPMGIPGDSGAWVVDRRHGQLCGHVLAWSQRKQVAYICPMDVLLLDVAQTLEANEVRLPGGDPVISLKNPSDSITADDTEVRGPKDPRDVLAAALADLGSSSDEEDEEDNREDDLGDTPNITTVDREALRNLSNQSLEGLNRSCSEQSSSSPIRMDMSMELPSRSNMASIEVHAGRGPRIGVSG